MKSYRRSHLGKLPPPWIPIYSLMFLFLMVYYLWNLNHGPVTFQQSFRVGGGYYDNLAEAFVAGHTYLKYIPDPLLAKASDPYALQNRLPGTSVMLDLSYYIGKDHVARYYMYWGPAPCLLYYCPIKYLFNCNISNLIVYEVMCGVNFLIYASTIRLLVVRYFTKVPVYFEAILLLIYGFCNILPYNQLHPAVYEQAITCAASFAMASLLFCLLSLHSTNWRYFWILCASACAALAFGSRAVYLVLWGIPLLCWLYLVFQDTRKWYWRVPSGLFLFTPLIYACAGIMWYNYVRFNDPFQFGVKYILNSESESIRVFSIRFIPDSVWQYLFNPFQFVLYYPYLAPTKTINIPYFDVARPREDHCGLFVIHPIALLSFGWFYYARKLNDPILRRQILVWGGLCSLWILAISLVIFCWYFVTFRYEMELQMPLLLLTSITLLARRQTGPLWHWEKVVLTILVTYSCYCGFAMGLWGCERYIVSVRHLMYN